MAKNNDLVQASTGQVLFYAPRKRKITNNRVIKSKAMEYKFADNNEGKGNLGTSKWVLASKRVPKLIDQGRDL